MEKDVLDFEHFNPQMDEIEKIFTVPLQTLLEPTYRKTEFLTKRIPRHSVVMNYTSTRNHSQKSSTSNIHPRQQYPYNNSHKYDQKINHLNLNYLVS